MLPPMETDPKILHTIESELRKQFPDYSIRRFQGDDDKAADTWTFEVERDRRRYLFTFGHKFLRDTKADAITSTLESLRGAISRYTEVHVLVQPGGGFYFRSWKPR